MAETLRMSQLRRLVLLLAFWFVAAPASATPLAREDVPEPLRPWVDWVLRGHEAETCPFLHARSERECVWPGRLELRLDAQGGRFTQQVYVAAESELQLPGAAESWPEEVRVDGAGVPVFERGGRPALRLARGAHEISGRFVWSALPPVLLVPAGAGLVSLHIDGARVAFPRRDTEGRLWLRDAEVPAPREAADHLDVELHRRIVDAIPLELQTRISLRVSGGAREELLGRVLPDGFVPTGLSGPLPARLDPDGRLRVQVRAGHWVFALDARSQGPVAEITLPLQSAGAHWDASEVWSFAARPALRLVEIEGAAAVDPTQTELPAEWRALPAYRIEPGKGLRLVEKRRGIEGAAADRLSLSRTWHLDFDGAGATVVDAIQGELRAATRLEMGAATTLGRAALNGTDQPVTTRAEGAQRGVELPLGTLSLEADSRIEASPRRLPAVGWDFDVDALQATLELPPGWRLLHVSGVDRATPTWIGRWTLLDLFVVMVVAMATLRLFGPGAAALALGALVLLYTESNAPRWVWLVVLVAEALRRVVPEGRLARAVHWLRIGAIAALVAIAVPFAISQVRMGLFPALERPWEIAAARSQFEAEADLAATAAPEAARVQVEQKVDVVRRSDHGMMLKEMPASIVFGSGSGSYANVYAPDPNARVQTGPGRPDWSWQQVTLSWSGPVARDQQLGLWLLPPWLSGMLALVRVALLAAFVLLLLRAAWPGRGVGAAWPRLGPVTALALALVATSAPARAELPTPELLNELRTRLLEPPLCLPNCATAPRLALEIEPDRLELRLAVDVVAETAVPLPSGGTGENAGFTPDRVVVDGRVAEALRRDAAGQLWLRLAAGSHVIQLAGPLPARANVEIPLPLRPQRVELIGTPRGWTLLGLDAAGRVSGALQLARDATPAPGSAQETQTLEPSAIPPFVVVIRTLQLGLSWQVHTQVARVAPPEGAVVLEVPLLPGESVTTAGVRVQDGRALVTLGPDDAGMLWNSVLAISPALALEAPRDVAWMEVWRLDPSPLWHVSPQGIPAVDAPAQGSRLREWRPWPGEKLALAIERPEGAGGETLTIDRSQLSLSPGPRATDATLTLSLRSSQGGNHVVTLPEGAELTGLTLDGAPQSLRQEGLRVAIPLVPGEHSVTLTWREPRGIRAFFRGSSVDLGVPSVNAHTELSVPAGRWLLHLGGPRLGPSVLFWPTLLVVAALAIALGRIRWTPLRTLHWLALGIGLTQAPLPASALVVVWLLALGWRGRLSEAERTRSVLGFDLLQIALVLLTGIALAALFHAIQTGLLGSPEMRVAGNGSDAFLLRWYQDRAGAVLPKPWMLSLSLWFYRAAMLVWALWIAQALVGWLRWGWQQWSQGGYWLRRVRPSVVA